MLSGNCRCEIGRQLISDELVAWLDLFCLCKGSNKTIDFGILGDFAQRDIAIVQYHYPLHIKHFCVRFLLNDDKEAKPMLNSESTKENVDQSAWRPLKPDSSSAELQMYNSYARMVHQSEKPSQDNNANITYLDYAGMQAYRDLVAGQGNISLSKDDLAGLLPLPVLNNWLVRYQSAPKKREASAFNTIARYVPSAREKTILNGKIHLKGVW